MEVIILFKIKKKKKTVIKKKNTHKDKIKKKIKKYKS